MNHTDNSIINAIANHNFVIVPRNCAERQERWKKVDERISQRFEEIYYTSEISFSEVLKQTLSDPDKNEGLSADHFVEHLLGCGCCNRHASGINIASSTLPFHVRPASNTQPQTLTLEGKACCCRCRHLVRSVVRSYQNFTS